jgi:hypothetical protein
MYNILNLFPFVDCALMDTNTIETNNIFESIRFTEKDSPKAVAEKLYNSKVVFIHPDGFDYWSDVLVILQQKKELPIKIFIFGGSDYFFDDEVLEIMTCFFATSKFFISNYIGSHHNCYLLPIGSTLSYNKEISKKCNFAIPNITLNCGYRYDFCKFIERNDNLKPYILPHLPVGGYLDVLASLRFSTAPRGNGHDTGRFWECLMLGVIPIVERDIFYERLRETYPKLPFIMLDKWDDLDSIVDTLNEEKHKEIFESSDLTILNTNFWINKVKEIISS